MVIELADALHYDPRAPFVLVGHSRGCSVTTACAAGFPDRVCALVTFESAYGLIGTFPMNQGEAATTGNHKLELVLAADRAGLARGKRTRVFESLHPASVGRPRVFGNSADPPASVRIAASRGPRVLAAPRVFGISADPPASVRIATSFEHSRVDPRCFRILAGGQHSRAAIRTFAGGSALIPSTRGAPQHSRAAGCSNSNTSG